MAEPAAQLTLVSRVDCGLCIELAQALTRLGVPYETADVDEDPTLFALYNEAVPVLLKDGTEIGRAPFDEASLQAALRQSGVLP